MADLLCHQSLCFVGNSGWVTMCQEINWLAVHQFHIKQSLSNRGFVGSARFHNRALAIRIEWSALWPQRKSTEGFG